MIAAFVSAQSVPESPKKYYDVKRCTPKIEGAHPFPNT